MTITTNVATKVAAVATGLTMAVSMLAAAPIAHAAALTSSQVSAIISLLQSFGADSATIANVQASLTGSAPTGGTGGTSSCSLTRDLTVGSKGADVTCLQNALIKAGYSIPAGATGTFGPQTQAAVIAWQKSAGVTPAAGYFGAKSRAAFGLSGGSTGNPGGPITGNGLKVMLASDSPNMTALVQGQASALLGKFTFQNPTASPITVTNVAFKRMGVSNDSTLTNVYLYNGAARLTDSAGVSSGAFNFNNPAGLFVIGAGSSLTVSVRSDIDPASAGQQIGVQLTSVASSGVLDSSVSFPIVGGLQIISAATLANVDLNTTTLPSATTVDPQADYTVWQNTVTISTRAVIFKAFALKNIGSILPGDVVNFRLYVDGVKIAGPVASVDANNMVTFDLSAAPVTLQTGGRVIKVIADVVGGASRTFAFSLRYPGDALFVDTDLGQPVLLRGSSSSTTGTFAAHGATTATINSVSTSAPTITRATDSPTSNVALNTSNVKWASFKIIANGEAIKVDNLNVSVGTSTPGGAASNPGLDNGKVFLNGVQIGSTKDIAAYGGATTNYTFGSSFIVPVGTVAVLDIYADAKAANSSSLTTGDTVKIYLGVGASNAQGQTSLSAVNLPASELTGNSITVTSSALTATKASYYGNQTVIAGSSGAKVGAFTLSAGSTEGVNVNTIEIGFAAGVGSTITNLVLKDHTTGALFGTSKGTVGTANSFTGSLTIPASGTVTYDIYADVKTSAAAANTIAPTITTSTTGTGALTGSSVTVAATVNLQTITVNAGTLTVTQNTGSTPDNANIIAGTSAVKLGAFRFTSAFSSYTVDQLLVKVPANGAATSVGSVMLKYLDVNGAQQTVTQALALPTANTADATATFSGLTFYVPQDANRDLEVWVSVPTIQSGATSGVGISAKIDFNEGVHLTDAAGTASTTLAGADLNSATVTGKGNVYVHKSLPTVASTPITSTLAAGTDQVLGRFTVTADAAGDIDWGQVLFQVDKSLGAITIGATTTIKVWDVTGSATNVAGAFATSTTGYVGAGDTCANQTTCTIHFRPTTVQTVSAGSTRTYELRGTVGGFTTAALNSISVTIPNPSTSKSANAIFTTMAGTFGTPPGTNASFVWSDWSDTTDHATSATGSATSDWNNDYLVKTLPITIGSRQIVL